MARAWNFVPRIAIFLAGVVAGAIAGSRRERDYTPEIQDLKQSLADLESRVATQNAATAGRFEQVQARLEEHTAKLADMPSTSHIVAAMEQLLSRTMTSLDERLSAQAHSIEVLKTTVAQTDGLLERVLESLDLLQSHSESADLTASSLLEKPTV
jgi:uncharacterized coiled-coil protein SlyX